MFRRLLEIFGLRRPFSQTEGKDTWVTVIISFLIAVTLWLVVTLNNKTYQSPLSYPVKVTNIPSQVQLRSDLPSEMIVLAEGTGIDLLLELAAGRRDTILIDFQKHAQNEFFYSASHLSTINKALPNSLKALTAQPDTLRLKYENKSFKRVPVVSRVNFDYQDSYRPVKPMEIYPEQVLVIGPEEELDKIRYWPTSEILTERTNLSVPLDTIDPFEVIPKSVRITVEPEPFTEAEQFVKIEIRGSDPNLDLKIEPEGMLIKYLVPINRYEEVDASSFSLVIDIEKVNLKTPYLLPQIEKQPDFVTVSGFDPAFLKYKIQELK